jgi:hypothetical protein
MTFRAFRLYRYRNPKNDERTRKRQGWPSLGTPTPPGYGYLTHHLPRKVTHARISDSATEQVLTHETRGKKTQLYNPTIKMLRPQRPQKNISILKTNCSCRLRHRHVEEQHPRRRFHPRQNPARPQTATRAEGSPPQRRKLAPCLGPRQPRQASGPRLRQPPLRRVSEREMCPWAISKYFGD